MNIKDIDVIVVDNDIDEIMCDGGHASLGHPAVFYGFGNNNEVICDYCGRKFVKDS